MAARTSRPLAFAQTVSVTCPRCQGSMVDPDGDGSTLLIWPIEAPRLFCIGCGYRAVAPYRIAREDCGHA